MNGTVKILMLLLLALFAACSSPSDDDGASGDAGTLSDGGRGDFIPLGPAELKLLGEGIYAGRATGDNKRDATLGLWASDLEREGRLVLDRTDSFSIILAGDRQTLSVIDASCQGCTSDTSWDLNVGRDGSILQFVVVPGEKALPGFDGFVMVPHDGFKPERFPEPSLALWSGPVLAVVPEVDGASAFDASCELGVDAEEERLEFFSCYDTRGDSPWVNQVMDSWVNDGGSASFAVDAAGVRLGYVGTIDRTPGFPTFRGEIYRLEVGQNPGDDAPVVGAFTFELNNP